VHDQFQVRCWRGSTAGAAQQGLDLLGLQGGVHAIPLRSSKLSKGPQNRGSLTRWGVVAHEEVGLARFKAAEAALTCRGVVAHEQVTRGAADGALRGAAAQRLRPRPHHLREVAGAVAEPCKPAGVKRQRPMRTALRPGGIGASTAGHVSQRFTAASGVDRKFG